jgi:hypothetical protein
MIKDKRIHVLVYIIILLTAAQWFLVIEQHSKKIKGFSSWIMLPKEEKLSHSWGTYYKWVSFIRDKTPEDSLIILPPQGDKFPVIGNAGLCDYFIFPRFGAHENDRKTLFHTGPIYRVNMDGFEYNKTYLEQYILNKDFSLLLLKERQEKTPAHPTDFTRIKGTFANIFLALLKLLLITTSGIYIVSNYSSERSYLGFLTTSFLVGATISAIFYLLLSLIRIDFTEPLQFVFLGMLSAPSIPLLIKRKSSMTFPQNSHPYNGLSYLVVGVFFCFLFLKSMSTPIITWDACAIWAIKAKAIFAFHNLKGYQLWGELKNYPPLLPIFMSQMAIGGEGIVKLIFPVFALCLYANIYDEILQTGYSPPLKIILPTLIFTAPLIFIHSTIAYANFTFTVFVTKSLTILTKLLKHDTEKGWPILSILLCGVLLVRPDGQAYFFYLVVLTFLWICFQRHSFRNLLYLLIPSLSILLWKLYLPTSKILAYGIIDPLLSKASLANIEKINWLDFKLFIISLINYSLRPQYWGFISILFIVLCLFRKTHLIKRYFPECFFVLIGFLGLSFFSFLWCASFYGGFHRGIQDHFTFGFPRYIMVFLPIMLIIMLKEIDKIVGETFKVSSQ